MKSNIASLAGNYQRSGSTLKGEKIILSICPRKKTSPNKPDSFLVARTSTGQPGQYISSLYPIGGCIEERARFDYNGQTYILTLDNLSDQAWIETVTTLSE